MGAPWLQKIAEYLGANEPSNGNWSQTIYEQLISVSGNTSQDYLEENDILDGGTY
jgi:hypothetical protein